MPTIPPYQHTAAAHVIPYYLYLNHDGHDPNVIPPPKVCLFNYVGMMIIMTSVVSQQSCSGEALSALQRLGGIPPEAIWGHNINRLSNIITMGYGLHLEFRKLVWWLKPASGKVSLHCSIFITYD